VNATEQVRRQIGQDLHDMLSSDLAAAAMKAGNLRTRLAEKTPEETEALDDIIQTIRDGAEQARTLSHALVPVSLQEEHLAAALENLCREQEELGALDCTFEGDREESLPTDKETAMHLYRIAHEAVVNARQHADANHLWISLDREADRLVMTVRDDGVGLPDDVEKGLGLRSMAYRANLIGASLSATSGDEGGTTVRCALPLSTAQAD
jgi:two-component system CheB/CheR fusion protein